jgi:hypothetical protein
MTSREDPFPLVCASKGKWESLHLVSEKLWYQVEVLIDWGVVLLFLHLDVVAMAENWYCNINDGELRNKKTEIPQ